MFKFKTIFIIAGLLLMSMLPTMICYAATTANTNGLFPNPSKISTIEELLEAIINFVYAMSFPIVTGVVLYAAFVMMTSAGKPEKFQQGITIIIYAAIGFIVVLLSKGVVFIIRSIFGA